MKYLLDSYKMQCVGIRSSIDNSDETFESWYIMQQVTSTFILPVSSAVVAGVSSDQMMLILHIGAVVHQVIHNLVCLLLFPYVRISKPYAVYI